MSTPSSTTPASTSTPSATSPSTATRRVVAVNVLAPYLLTALINRPARLIYLSSGMHTSGRARPRRPRLGPPHVGRCPGLLRLQAATSPPSPPPSPGTGPTRAATPSTPAGSRHAWAAHTPPTTSPSATTPKSGWPPATNRPPTTTGKYWYHRQVGTPAAAVNDTGFQDHLLETLERITGVRLPRAIDGRRTTERTST